MTSTLQKLTYLVCEHAEILPPEEQFPHHSISLKRSGAQKILDGLNLKLQEEVEVLKKECWEMRRGYGKLNE